MTGETEELGEIAARLRESVHKAGGNAKVAAKSGIPLGTLNKYLTGKTEPGVTKLKRIAEATDRTVEYFVTGAGNPVQAQVSGDLVLLPHFPTQPSAGSGAVASPDTDSDGSVAFSAGWLRLIGVNPRRAHVLTAKGDSMEPTIRDGDLLIVDRSIDRIVDAGIYVVTVGGMVVVKRVQVNRDGTLILRSDNGRYHDEVIPADELYTITIEGRVCWSGRPM